LFKLPSGNKDDYAVVFTSDYLLQIEATKERMRAKNKDNFDENIFDLFIEKLLPRYFDVTISKTKLQEVVEQKVSERDITLLVNAGLLLLRDVDTFWLAIPNAGAFIKSCIQGRKEVLGIIKKTKWKELLGNDLEKKKLRFSSLPIIFHTKDLVGQGVLETVDTTAGVLYKLSNR